MVKMKRIADETYHGADSARNVSLTVHTGEVVDVTDDKALEMLAEGGWEQLSGIPIALPQLEFADIVVETKVEGDGAVDPDPDDDPEDDPKAA